MKIGVEKLEDSRVELTVSVETATLKDEVDSVTRNLIQRSNIPGFRRGKAPRSVIERRFGKEAILSEAFETALPRILDEAMKEAEVSPIGTPELSDLQFNEAGSIDFKLTFDVFPEINLGEYKGIEVEAKDVVVTDDMVEEALRELQEDHTELVIAERDEVEKGDTIIGEVQIFIEDEPFYDEPKELGIKVDDEEDAFAENLLGAKRDTLVDFVMVLPEDFANYNDISEYAGEECRFEVVIKEIKEERVPELDDDFARDVGEFESLDELKEDLRRRIKEVMEVSAESELRTKILDILVERSSFELPKTLVDEYIDKEFETVSYNLQSYGVSMAHYIERQNLTEDHIREELRPKAQLAARRALIVGKVAEVEDLRVSEEELEEEIKKRVAAFPLEYKEHVEELYASSLEMQSKVESELLFEKTLDFLREAAKIVRKGDNSDEPSADSSRADG
jgi:trigger factor